MSILLQTVNESWIKGIDEWLGAIDHVIVIAGVPSAIATYFYARKKDRDEAASARKARELATYTALDEKYLEFEQLCLRHPELDVFDVPDDPPHNPTPMQQKRELVAFTMLFSLFERAFYMYRGQTSDLRRAQWTGWDEFIAGYCLRANFQSAWAKSGSTFDRDFQLYMDQKVMHGQQQSATHRP